MQAPLTNLNAETSAAHPSSAGLALFQHFRSLVLPF